MKTRITLEFANVAYTILAVHDCPGRTRLLLVHTENTHPEGMPTRQFGTVFVDEEWWTPEEGTDNWFFTAKAARKDFEIRAGFRVDN